MARPRNQRFILGLSSILNLLLIFIVNDQTICVRLLPYSIVSRFNPEPGPRIPYLYEKVS